MENERGLEGFWITTWVSAAPHPVPGRHPTGVVVSGDGDGWRVVRHGALGDVEGESVTLSDGTLTFRERSEPAIGTRYAMRWRDDDTVGIWWNRPEGEPHLVGVRVSEEGWRAALAAVPLPPLRRIELPELEDIPELAAAAAPPLGWNSWNLFRETVSDPDIREMADALVSSGLRDAGYVYLNIDDGWQGARDEDGVLRPNEKFPDMPGLARYVHERGLRFGIYSSPGPLSCGGYLGSHGFEEIDARTFAEWGVDLLKYDWCSAGDLYSSRDEMHALYQRMGTALRSTGRPILYSLCQYGLHDVGEWGWRVGASMWRTGGDTVEGDRWEAIDARFETNGDPSLQGPGRFNDADMMLVGLPGIDEHEAVTHLTLWTMSASPIILGHDLRTADPAATALLANREVLAVNQDPLGLQGRAVLRDGAIEAWTKPLADGSVAVALFNRGDAAAVASATWEQVGLAIPAAIRDLWNGVDLDPAAALERPLPRHGAAMYRVTPA